MRSIGFISHMDTADFNAVGVNPQIIENYDGESDDQLDAEERYTLNTKDFPNLKNYEGHTLILQMAVLYWEQMTNQGFRG